MYRFFLEILRPTILIQDPSPSLIYYQIYPLPRTQIFSIGDFPFFAPPIFSLMNFYAGSSNKYSKQNKKDESEANVRIFIHMQSATAIRYPPNGTQDTYPYIRRKPLRRLIYVCAWVYFCVRVFQMCVCAVSYAAHCAYF